MSYIVHENKVYQEVENPLFSIYKQVKIPERAPTPEWKGAKLPWAMWQELVSWCQITQELYKSEALVYLFYDETKNEWSHWYVPQKTRGMTVQANHEHPQYKLERKAYPDLQFGSLHHHCTSGAFASSTDKDDEVDREGLHFTVGDIGSAQHSVHTRLSLGGVAYEIAAEDVIEPCGGLDHLPEDIQRVVHKTLIHRPMDHKQFDFTECLKNVEVVKFTPPVSQFNRGNTIGWNGGQTTWWDDEGDEAVSTEKKTLSPEEQVYEELADYIDTWVDNKMLTNKAIDKAREEQDPYKEILVLTDKASWRKQYRTEYYNFITEAIEIIAYRVHGEMSTLRADEVPPQLQITKTVEALKQFYERIKV